MNIDSQTRKAKLNCWEIHMHMYYFNFFKLKYKVLICFSLDFLKPDNQTICGYSHLQFATICVRVCTGDFCNGPTAGTNLRASTVSLGLLAFGTVLYRIIIRGT